MSELKVPNYPLPRDARLAYHFTYNQYCKLYTREVYGKTVWIVVCPEFALRRGSVTLCSQPSLSPDKMWGLMGRPDVLLNAGFFGANTGASIWNLKCDGEIISHSQPPMDRGVGFKTDGGFRAGGFNGGEGWRDYVTVYPELFSIGKRVNYEADDIDYAAYRTCLGWTRGDSDLNLCWTLFFMVSSAKITLSELQDLIYDLFPTVEWAGNLDGGGSSYLKWDGVRFHPDPSVSWIRPVDSVLGLWFKTQEEIAEDFASTPSPSKSKIRYTVQLGAFTNRSYAENYLKEIQALKTSVHDYGDAYLTKQDKYWKVQCGSFSKRENAERMSEDLKELGYDNYIKAKVLD